MLENKIKHTLQHRKESDTTNKNILPANIYSLQNPHQDDVYRHNKVEPNTQKPNLGRYYNSYVILK